VLYWEVSDLPSARGKESAISLHMARTKQKSKLRLGSKGACEATLHEFTLSCAGADPKAQMCRVAATSIGEAVLYVVKTYRDCEVKQIQTIGFVEVVSGSPLN
jgi:hypothetical protein